MCVCISVPQAGLFCCNNTNFSEGACTPENMQGGCSCIFILPVFTLLINCDALYNALLRHFKIICRGNFTKYFFSILLSAKQ